MRRGACCSKPPGNAAGRASAGPSAARRGCASKSVEGDTFYVVIVAASGGRPGERLAYKREALYATRGDERRAFEQLVAFLWSDR